MVEIAHAVAHDCVRRPRRYRGVPEDISRILEGFRSHTGFHSDWPSSIQRAALYSPLLGQQFCAGSLGLWQAAAVLVEGSSDSDKGALGQVFRDEVVTFRAYLETLDRQALAAVDRQTETIFRSAMEVFRSEAIARTFGLPQASGEDWPFGEAFSGDAGYLIEEVCQSLRLWNVGLPMTQRRFLLLQRAARYGALTITGVLDGAYDRGDGTQSETLIQSAYSWEKALRGLFLNIDIVRAWKNPEYRENLTQAEKELMPRHPAGSIDLKDTDLDAIAVGMRAVGLGFSTQTIGPAICCCTGDLPCPYASEGSDYCCPTNIGFTCPSTDCGSGCSIPA
jgi:mersacidin/lichenicidin family type 2 lantibiotic